MRTKTGFWCVFLAKMLTLVARISWSRGGQRANKQIFVKSQCAALKRCMYVYMPHEDVVNYCVRVVK